MSVPAFRRSLLLPIMAFAVALLSAGAQAQWKHGAFKHRWVGAVPMDEISSGDIAQALIWTGHLGIGLNKAVANDPKKAMEAWQIDLTKAMRAHYVELTVLGFFGNMISTALGAGAFGSAYNAITDHQAGA